MSEDTVADLTITITPGNGQLTAVIKGLTNGSPCTIQATEGKTVVKATAKPVAPVKPPVPAVTGVSPDNGPTIGGTKVTIIGEHLAGTTKVSFGGLEATSFEVVSAEEITAVTPPA
jgi:hypothetical protein